MPEKRDWGPWRLKEDYVLEGLDYYPIDLEELTESSEVLDFIIQVAGKSLWPSEALPGLVYALDDLLHLQANMCGSGENMTLTPKAIRDLVDKFDA